MPDVKLVISLENGQFNVQGPIHDAVLCYGLLELAKDAIRKNIEHQQSRIVPAAAVPRLVPNGR